MLIHKPHTVTVHEAMQPVETINGADKSVGVREFGAGLLVRGQVSPGKAEAIFAKTGIALLRPHKFLCELADAAKFKVGNRVKMGARRFTVSEAPTSLYNAGLATDHAAVFLEEDQYRA